MNANPYQTPTLLEATNTQPKQRPQLLTVTTCLTIAATIIGGVLLLLAREGLVRTLYWGRPITLTDGSDTELVLHAFLTAPVWSTATTQVAIVLAPAAAIFLLRARRFFGS